MEEDKVKLVLNQMRSYLKLYSQNPEFNHLIPFLRTYEIVTTQVLHKYQVKPQYYQEFAQTAHLDQVFANLYFNPTEKFLANKRPGAPWETYFEYCTKGADNPFLQVIMGINVHINADLPHAIITSNFTQKADFDAINQILLDSIPQLMRYLFFEEHEILGLAGMIMRRFFIFEFKHIVVEWRKQAWVHAEKLRTGEITQKQLDQAADQLSKQLWANWEQNYKLHRLPFLLLKLNKAQVLV